MFADNFDVELVDYTLCRIFEAGGFFFFFVAF